MCAESEYKQHQGFWDEIIKDKDEKTIVDGVVYSFDKNRPIASSTYRSEWLGFDGKYFKIRFFNGEEYLTNNLWYNSKIPEEIKHLLPDNAEFITI